MSDSHDSEKAYNAPVSAVLSFSTALMQVKNCGVASIAGQIQTVGNPESGDVIVATLDFLCRRQQSLLLIACCVPHQFSRTPDSGMRDLYDAKTNMEGSSNDLRIIPITLS